MNTETLRRRLLETVTDDALRAIIADAPAYMFKRVSEYTDTRIERVISLAYTHAFHYAMSLDHAYKSILWTIRHANALHARNWEDALTWIEKQEDARYSANNLERLIGALNEDIEDTIHADYTGLTAPEARRIDTFKRGLYERKAATLDAMERQAAAFDHVKELEATEEAREFIKSFLSTIREDARTRVHAIARIMRRADVDKGTEYIARGDINRFLNRLYNRAAYHDAYISDYLTQADFVYLLIKYA